ncbi:toxin-antitoxin system HicB family antitoxin [soil metagenome]
MRLDPIMTQIESAVEAQLRMMGSEAAEAAMGFVDAFRPAIRAALLEAAQQSAAEVSAQLGDRRVDVHLTGGDPELVVSTSDENAHTAVDDDEMEARITLRLPGALKGVIEDAASSSGDSINSWVVETLRSSARRKGRGTRVDETILL